MTKKKHQVVTNEKIFNDMRDEYLKDFTLEGQLRILTALDRDREFEDVLLIERPEIYKIWQDSQYPFSN